MLYSSRQLLGLNKKTLHQTRGGSVGTEIPSQGEPEDYDNGSPEQKLAEYLTLWKRKNYGYMANCLSEQLWPGRNMPARVRELCESKALRSFRFLSVTDEAPAISIIETALVIEEDDQTIEQVIPFRMFRDFEKNPESINPMGQWSVVNWNAI